METNNEQPNGGNLLYALIAIAGGCYAVYVLLTI